MVVNNRFTDAPTCVGAGDYGAIADTSGFRGNPDEDYANARLIAAAPEMLQVLKWFVLADDDGEVIRGSAANRGLSLARALLARIEGEDT